MTQALLFKIIVSIAPIPLFYLIYLRYFSLKSKFSEHMQSFLSGVALALFIMIMKPAINDGLNFLLSFDSPWLKGFIQAAVIEKLGAFFLIMFIQRRYPNFSIMEAALSAMTFGLGFSMIENIFYAAGRNYSIILVRILFSVPLHLTTCGILGYYLGLRKFCKTKLYKNSFIFKGLFYSILLHGVFDSLLIQGGKISYFVAPMLIFLVIILEYLLAKSQNFIPLKILRALEVRFEDWLTIHRQPRYERWIIQSMGMPGVAPAHFFLWRPGIIRFLLVILFIVFSIIGLSFKVEILHYLNLSLSKHEQVMILGIFPASISFIIILVGAINPRYFKDTEMKMPVISDVEVHSEGKYDETMITYDISAVNCFIRTAEEIGVGTDLYVKFECPSFSSPVIHGRVIWENYLDKQEPVGAVIELIKPSFKYKIFFIKYLIFRYLRGFWFNLRLPGFETTRKLFMRPITTMQEERVYEKGDKIFDEGEKGDEFYLLKKGRVLFYKNKAKTGEIITMDTVTSGQIFGEMAIVKEDGRAATAVCLDDCVVAVANRENMDALIRSNPDFALNLIRTLTERVQMSEKILVGNIRNLQAEKIEKEHLFHVAILLTMIGLGVDARSDMGLDVSKLQEVVKHMDDEEVSSEIINLVMKKQQSDNVGNEDIANAINGLFEKFKKDPNEG